MMLLSFCIVEKHVRAENIALADMVTDCSVSNYAQGIHYKDCCGCYQSIDNNFDTSWNPGINSLNEWIQLDFAGFHIVFRVDIYHRCRYATQCNGMDMAFSDGTMTSVSNPKTFELTFHLALKYTSSLYCATSKITVLLHRPVLLILSMSVPNLVTIGSHLTSFVTCATFSM